MTALELNEDDLIRIHTGNGGGYGNPRERRCELLVEDVRNGYVTAEEAALVYS